MADLAAAPIGNVNPPPPVNVDDDDDLVNDNDGMAAAGGSLEKKRRRKRNHIDSVLPPRPKKAATAYSMFLKEYFRTRNGIATPNSMKDASEQWTALVAAEKTRLERLCDADRERYTAEMALWNQQRAYVKRPASCYALFLKDVWAETGTRTGRSISEMGKLAGARWKAMTAEEKQVYRDRYIQNVETKKTRMTNLAAGHVILNDQGVLQVDPNAGGVAVAGAVGGQGQGQGDANDLDSDDDDDDEM